MTCEVICMNRQGLSIAVDSAVSLGRTGKAHPNADKLFPLGEGLPVAIATYGAADFIGLPWKLVIEAFIAQRGDGRKATLKEYAEEFTAFLQSDHVLFTREAEEEAFEIAVLAYWRRRTSSIFGRFGNDTRQWPAEAWTEVREMLQAEDDYWTFGPVPELPEDFTQQLFGTFADRIASLFEHWFDGVEPPDDIRAGYALMIERLFTQAANASEWTSGIVFLGFGEEEVFPRYLEMRIESRILGKLRYDADEVQAIDLNNRAEIRPLAQTDMVDAFVLGTPHRMLRQLRHHVRDAAERAVSRARGTETDQEAMDVGEEVEEAIEAFRERLHNEYRAPLIESVAGLPIVELARLSRALVSVAAFRSQLAANDTGTVGGEIRVATISRYGGVKWVG